MSATNKFVIIRIAAFLVILVAFCLAYGYHEELKTTVKSILESNWLLAFTSIYIVSCAVMYQIFVGGNSDFGGLIHAQFGKYADFVFAIITYVPSSATSLALLKGLFMQYFFRESYFQGFGSLDIASIVIVSSYLLYFSLFNSTRLLINAVFQVNAISVSGIRDEVE